MAKKKTRQGETLYKAIGSAPILSASEFIGSLNQTEKFSRNSNAAGEKKRPKNVGSEPGSRDPVGLRIIGGSRRGKKLIYTGDHRVRPMKDRVRESVFNLIGPAVKDKFVIDLFAGTGALALESLSRGSKFALLVEMHIPTAKNAIKNINELGFEENSRVLMTDTFYWAHTMPETDLSIPWLVFCSPPYDFYVDRLPAMLEMLTTLWKAAPQESMFVIESDCRLDFSTLPFEIPEKRRRSYPPAEIAIAQKI